MKSDEYAEPTLRHWPWKVYAIREEDVSTPENYEVLIIHAPHRAAAKKRMWEYVDFEPDYIDAYVHNKLKQIETERKMQEFGDGVEEVLMMVAIVMLTMPLWYPPLRAYELVIGRKVTESEVFPSAE